jgi:hypothetical protein
MDKDFKVTNPDWSRLTFHTYSVDDATMVDPQDATRVIQGEWVELTADDKVIRCTDEEVLHFPMVDIPGQYDVQAVEGISVIKLGNFEVETTVYDTATLNTLGQPFMIDSIAFLPGPNNRGIPTLWLASPDVLVGYVTKAPSSGVIKLQTVIF